MKYSAVKSRPRTETIEPLKLRTIKLWACISESPCFHWPKLRRRVELPADIERPQDANFVAWSALLMDQLCAGGGNKELRQHLKNIAKEIMF